MHGYYGAPRPLLVDLLDRRDWAPADVYYACAIAHALGIPCIDVVHEYDRHPGQGWGVVAKRLGIKPGSAAFHALKRGQVDTYRRWGQTIVVDRPVHVDWSRSGPGRGRADNRPDRGEARARQHAATTPPVAALRIMATAETRASPATKATTTRATTRARAVAGTGTASRNPAADACASTKAGPARGPAFFVQGRAVAEIG